MSKSMSVCPLWRRGAKPGVSKPPDLMVFDVWMEDPDEKGEREAPAKLGPSNDARLSQHRMPPDPKNRRPQRLQATPPNYFLFESKKSAT